MSFKTGISHSSHTPPLQFTLPVSVGYKAMDEGLLKRFWGQAGRGAQRDSAPAELADRCLVFYRGVSLVSRGVSHVLHDLRHCVCCLLGSWLRRARGCVMKWALKKGRPGRA